MRLSVRYSNTPPSGETPAGVVQRCPTGKPFTSNAEVIDSQASASLPATEAVTCMIGTVAWLRLCVEKVVHHWDDDGHALHQYHVSGIGQDGQSRCGARLHVTVNLATL